MAAQTRQVFKNIDTILAAVEATPSDVAKLTIALVDTVDPTEGFQAVPAEWATVRTAITVLLVSRLAPAPTRSLKSTRSWRCRSSGSSGQSRRPPESRADGPPMADQ
jgi:enamine deaminase RidA (YjgF/YER057c/UK114 family)